MEMILTILNIINVAISIFSKKRKRDKTQNIPLIINNSQNIINGDVIIIVNNNNNKIN